jgi:hypothetical protein
MGKMDTVRFFLTGGRPAKVRQLYGLIRPQTCPGLKKLRVGNRQGDGGYVMVDDFSGIEAVLSLGIGDEITWDMEMSARGLDIFQFDHTVEPPAEVATNHRLHFYKCGIASHTDPQQNLKTIEDILAEEMVEYSGDLILKMDIEGHEWESLALIPDEVLARFRQICIEIHNPLARPGQRVWRNRNVAVLQKLYRKFAPVHLHVNNAGFVKKLFGIRVPRALEITYIRRDGQAFSDSDDSFPGKYDAPNVPSDPEVMIGEILRQNGKSKNNLL